MKPALIAIALLLVAFGVLGSEVTEQETEAIDHRILLAFRTDDGSPIGPRWLASTMVNLSALGSGAVSTLVVGFAAIFLMMARRPAFAALVALCGLGAWGVMAMFKLILARPRPTIGSPLDQLATYSFPSGHTLAATAVYLTLGAVIAMGLDQRRQRLCVIVMAAFLALLVGVTRVYIGVHYPTDVLGGWLVGTAWALLCGLAARALHRASHARPEPAHRAAALGATRPPWASGTPGGASAVARMWHLEGAWRCSHSLPRSNRRPRRTPSRSTRSTPTSRATTPRRSASPTACLTTSSASSPSAS